MSSLLLSTEFWFGAAVLGAYHFAKFSELSSLDPDVAARSAQIPNLRAIDFAGKLAYCSALAAFLAVTFLTYLVLCSISPTILLGWAQVSGAKLDTDLTEFIDSVHYPLYIAAAFIGFTQPGIPVLSQIGNAQRNAFHAWMGVPTRVMNTSGWFSNQIFTRSPGAKQLAKEIQMLLSDGWIQRIDVYADADFYRSYIARLKLDDQAELLEGTRRELKLLTRQLVDAASLATVRESGMTGLSRLARDLQVDVIPNPAWPKAFLAGGMMFLVGMTVLWNLIPLFNGLAAALFPPAAGQSYDFWPDDLWFSGQYLIAQAMPIFLTTGIALGIWLNASARRQKGISYEAGINSAIGAIFYQYAWLFALIVMGTVAFDIFQAFFDLGAYASSAQSFWEFAKLNLPFYLLHSFISLVVCFAVLMFMDDDLRKMRWGKPITVTLTGLEVALVAVFYAATLVQSRFHVAFGPNGLDLAVLMVLVNVSGALLALASAAICKGQAQMSAGSAQPEQLPPAAPTLAPLIEA